MRYVLQRHHTFTTLLSGAALDPPFWTVPNKALSSLSLSLSLDSATRSTELAFLPLPANVHAGETMILRNVAATAHCHVSRLRLRGEVGGLIPHVFRYGLFGGRGDGCLFFGLSDELVAAILRCILPQ